MRVIVVALFILFSLPSFSCTVPRIGEEFDNLISVKKVGSNKFEAVAPVQAQDLKYGVEITVGYYPEGSEHRNAEYWKRVSYKEVGENYIVSFELKKIEGYIPYLEVFWWPEQCCTCGAYGKSRDLEIE